MNSGAALQLFDANTPPKAVQAPLGPGQQGTFASEFGGSVFSSAESMAPTFNQADWSPNAQPWTERKCVRRTSGRRPTFGRHRPRGTS